MSALKSLIVPSQGFSKQVGLKSVAWLQREPVDGITDCCLRTVFTSVRTQKHAGTKSNIIPPKRMVVDLIWHFLTAVVHLETISNTFHSLCMVVHKRRQYAFNIFRQMELTSKDYPKTIFLSVFKVQYFMCPSVEQL